MRPWVVLLGSAGLVAAAPIFISVALGGACFGGDACNNQGSLLLYFGGAIGLSVIVLAFGLLTSPRPRGLA